MTAGATPALVDVLRLHARYLADKPAIISEVEEVSYHQLLEGTDRVAAHLHDAGVRPASRVGVALQPSALHVAAIMALWELGAVVCPLNTRLAAEELVEFATPLDLSHVLVDPANSALAGAALAPAAVDWAGPDVAFDEASRPPGSSAPAARSPRRPVAGDDADPAMAFPTGGTTGTPKAALWSTAGLAAVVASNCIHLGIRRGDRELYLSPFFHIAILTGLFAPLYVGATVRLESPADTDGVIGAINSGLITRLFAVPTVLERVADRASKSEAIRTGAVRSVVFGASGSAEGFVGRLQELFPAADIYTGYGASEFGPVTRAYPSELQSGIDVGVGRPVAGVDIRILDEGGLDLGDDRVGEVVVRAPWQMLGYVGRRDPSDLVDGGIRSGDLGLLRDGYLHLQGRSKELIKSGGEQVFPLEVERVVMRHPSVSAVAAYGLPDPRWVERVECAVVVADGCTVTEEELRIHCRRSLAPFKVPKRFVFVAELPLTSNLKVDRRALVRAASHA